MKRILPQLFSGLLPLLALFMVPLRTSAQTQTARPSVYVSPHCHGYYEYLPQGYDVSQTYPLLIFIEGNGEFGDGSSGQITRLLDNGPTYYINQGQFPTSFTVNGQTFKFIIITPQFDTVPPPSDVDAVISYMAQHYRVNASRIYLTGLSSGGGITFEYAGASLANASRVAAILPFCGTSTPTQTKTRNIANANLPVWAFHNRYDNEVPDSLTENYVNMINQPPAPNPPARATIFNTTGHDCWSPAYYGSYTEGGLNIYQWMLQYQRGGSAPPPNQSPTANAGTNQTITLPNNTVQLNGNGTDPDGSISAYSWTKVSGPAAGSFSSPTTAATSVTGLTQGTYVFRLTVTDNQGATGTSDVTITVNPAPNQAPTANAGTNQTITLPTNSVQLNGSGSDPDGTISSYGWAEASGPSNASITNASQASTSVTGLVQGTYVFRLTVTDNQGATGSSSVTVTVNAAPNQPPVANAGSNQTITLPTNSVQLNGSGSDPDGSISSYNWSKVSGPSAGTIATPSAASTNVSGLTQGTYVFQLTVTDNRGATATSSVTITVNQAPNQPPVANAGSNQTITLPTSTVQLNGSGTDPDGTIAAYSWSKISGPSSGSFNSTTIPNPTVSGLTAGTYIFRLTVTDNSGAAAYSDVTVTVNSAANQAPTANAGSNQTITLPANSVQLNGSGSDPDGTISSYSWTQVSGPANASITYASQASTPVTGLIQGTYVFRLTVTDNQGATGLSSVTITVNSAPNQAPTANAGSAQTITLPTNSVQFNGSGSDADGTISAYQWSQLSGPNTAAIASTASASTQVSGLVQGSYQFRLTVTDNQGATGTSDVTVTVNAASGGGTTSSTIHIEAESYSNMSGVATESTTDTGGGLDVAYIDPNDWMDYSVNVPAAGTYTVRFRVATPAQSGQLQLRTAAGTVLTTVSVPNTGGWQSWQTVSATVSLSAGQQTLRIVCTSPAYNGWNINWFELQSGGTSTPPPPPPPPTGSTIHIEAETYSNMSGIQTESTTDAGGGLDVGYIDPNDWMDYVVNVPAAGTYTLNFRVASPANSAQFQLRTASGTVLATVSVPNTGGYQTWQTVNVTASLAAGQQTLRIVSTSPQWNGWNINWWEIAGGTSSTPPPTTGSTQHIEAESYSNMSGVATESTSDTGGGLDVAYIDPNDWMDYSVNVSSSGAYTIRFRIATPASNAQLQVRASNGTVLATVNLPNTGGYQVWQTVSTTVNLTQGQQTIRIVSTSPNWNNWNINWLELVPGTTSSASAANRLSAIASPQPQAHASIAPNPVTDHAVLSVNNAFTGRMDVQLVDMRGSVIKTFVLYKNIRGSMQETISLGDLRSGNYILSVHMQQWQHSIQLVKQ